MGIHHKDRGEGRWYSDDDIADIERLRTTMTLDQIGVIYGVSGQAIRKQIDSYSCWRDGISYRPRKLGRWGKRKIKWDFRSENLQVMN